MRLRHAILAGVLLVSLGHGLTVAGSAPHRPSSLYVKSTGHVLGDTFLAYWKQHEGRTTLGLPVSEPVAYAGGQAQFFEFGVLLARCDDDCRTLVRRLPVGSRLKRAGFEPTGKPVGRQVQTAFTSADSNVGTTMDVASQASLTANAPDIDAAGLLQTGFERLGGADRLGEPLSEPVVEGKKTVWWFQFGRLETSNGAVTLAPTGLELAKAAQVDTSRVPRKGRPLLDVGRYRLFEGDGTIPPALASFVPVQLRIPVLSVDAAIEQVPIRAGQMGEPVDPWRVGWYPAVSRPGDSTNVVLAGHRDWWNVGPTVFAQLDLLQPGDAVYLLDQHGSGFVYRVTESRVIPADTNAQEIVSDTGIETVTLVTCTGTFNGKEYESRRVVVAVRM